MRLARCAVVASVLLVPTAVLAQERPLLVQPYATPFWDEGGYGYGHTLGYPGVPIDALPTPFSHGGSCVKMCQYDQSPCDPDYWKVADRRCNYNKRG